MLFKRREKATLWERFRVWLWPRVSFRRSVTYFLKRTLRLSGTPYAIAIGSAAGVFASMTPFVGLHFILAVAIAWILRGNLIAGAVATFVGNPLTFPFIWVGTYKVGQLILHGSSVDAPPVLAKAEAHTSFYHLLPLIQPMIVGSIPIGVAAGCVTYFVVFRTVVAYRKSRRVRLAKRRMNDRLDPANGSTAIAGGSQKS